MCKKLGMMGVLFLVVWMISGCGSQDVSGKKVEKPQTKNPLFKTSLTLPNGVVVTSEKSVSYDDLSIQLVVTSLPSNTNEGYKETIGNHLTILTHETVSTTTGEVTIVLNKRTDPAAAKAAKETEEYWVIKNGSQYTYAIDATITGNQQKAKSEIFSLLKGWKVPQ